MIPAPEISPAVAAAIEHIRATDPNRLAKRPSLLLKLIVPSLSATEQAAQGSAWLDVTDPGWHREIRLDRLDLGSDETCVLGQLDGQYGDGAQERLKSRWHDLAPLLGFNIMGYSQAAAIGDGYDAPRFGELTEAWHYEISRRLASDTDAIAASEQADAVAVTGNPLARYL